MIVSIYSKGGIYYSCRYGMENISCHSLVWSKGGKFCLFLYIILGMENKVKVANFVWTFFITFCFL